MTPIRWRWRLGSGSWRNRSRAMPPEAVEAMSIDIGRVQSWLSGVLAKVTTRSSTLQRQGQRSDPKKTAARAGLGDREAAQATKRADAMQKMPDALGALEDGKIGVGHADALARQANRLSGAEKKAFEAQSDQLVADAIAEDLSVAAFERRCRELVDRLMGDDGVGELEKQRRTSRARTWVDDDTGMTHLTGEWDPIRGEAVSTVVESRDRGPGRGRSQEHHAPSAGPTRGSGVARPDLRPTGLEGRVGRGRGADRPQRPRRRERHRTRRHPPHRRNPRRNAATGRNHPPHGLRRRDHPHRPRRRQPAPRCGPRTPPGDQGAADGVAGPLSDLRHGRRLQRAVR